MKIEGVENFLKDTWEFASIVQFLFAFGRVIKLDETLVLEKWNPNMLLKALVEPENGFHLKLLGCIHCCLLKNLGKKCSPLYKKCQSWVSGIRKELKENQMYYQVEYILDTGYEQETVSLYQENGISILQSNDYVSISPSQRLLLLKYVCERVAETSEQVHIYIEEHMEGPSRMNGMHTKRTCVVPPTGGLEINNIRLRLLGKDGRGNEFVAFINQEPENQSFWIYSFESFPNARRVFVVLSTREELEQFIESFEDFKTPRDRVLVNKLREILFMNKGRSQSVDETELFNLPPEESSKVPNHRISKDSEEETIFNMTFGANENSFAYKSHESVFHELFDANSISFRKRKQICYTEESEGSGSIGSEDSDFEVSSDIESIQDDDMESLSPWHRDNHTAPTRVYYPLLSIERKFC
eukprot:jgi/Galph1/3662/GphlegSOOS_G2321.1